MNSWQVGLLETASKSAELAARTPYGSLETRLQAYRIWVVTSYMHEMMTRTSKDAKEEVMYIVGRVICLDPDLRKICSIYAGYSDVEDQPSCEESDEAEVTAVTTPRIGEPGAAGELSSVDALTVINFFLEIMSSVSMLPPLDQDVSCKHVMEVIGAGMTLGDNGQMELMGGEVVFGRDAPEGIILAMGKYCASRIEVAQMYPTVSTFAISGWEKNKERLALDSFFKSMGGENWIFNHGWMDKTGELRHRYGVAVEDGHVTKICLATNNLQGERVPPTEPCRPECVSPKVDGFVDVPYECIVSNRKRKNSKRNTRYSLNDVKDCLLCGTVGNNVAVQNVRMVCALNCVIDGSPLGLNNIEP